jgi:hypothetical protein
VRLAARKLAAIALTILTFTFLIALTALPVRVGTPPSGTSAALTTD